MQLIFSQHTCSVGFLLFFKLFICSFLKENALLISATQFHSYSPLFIPAMKKQGFACMHTSRAHSPLSEHPSFFPSIHKTERGNMTLCEYVCLCACLCVLWCLFIPSSTHTYTHAPCWVLGWKRMQASSMGHRPTSLQEVKETELFLHLQAATCRLFITAALRTEQSSNSRINCAFD